MSSILDALEKASREQRPGGRGGAAGPTLRERQLELEIQRGAERTRKIAIIAGVALFLVIGIGGFMFVNSPSPKPPTTANSSVVPSPQLSAPQPTPAMVAPTPYPTPTPYPSPTAAPTPAPTPQPTPEPTPTPSKARVRESQRDLLLKSLRDGQIISAEDIGWTIEGVMEMGDISFAMIDGEQVQTGTRYQGLHLIEVSSGLLTLDLGDGRIVKISY